MYSQEEIFTALIVYHQCESVARTITTLGYPTRRALYTWNKDENSQKLHRKKLCNISTANHPRTHSHKVKMSAIHRCFELRENIKFVSEDISYSRTSNYIWRKRYLQGTTALRNNKKIKPGALTENTASSSIPEIEQLQARIKDMQPDIDALKKPSMS